MPCGVFNNCLNIIGNGVVIEPEQLFREMDDLTARERDVLALICRGCDDKTIARTLDVAGNTVRNHVARIYAKIGVNNRAMAGVFAMKHGLMLAHDGEAAEAT